MVFESFEEWNKHAIFAWPLATSACFWLFRTINSVILTWQSAHRMNFFFVNISSYINSGELVSLVYSIQLCSFMSYLSFDTIPTFHFFFRENQWQTHTHITATFRKHSQQVLFRNRYISTAQSGEKQLWKTVVTLFGIQIRTEIILRSIRNFRRISS